MKSLWNRHRAYLSITNHKYRIQNEQTHLQNMRSDLGCFDLHWKQHGFWQTDISELSHQWFRNRLSACLILRYYLNQRRLIDSWLKSTISIYKISPSKFCWRCVTCIWRKVVYVHSYTTNLGLFLISLCRLNFLSICSLLAFTKLTVGSPISTLAKHAVGVSLVWANCEQASKQPKAVFMLAQ